MSFMWREAGDNIQTYVYEEKRIQGSFFTVNLNETSSIDISTIPNGYVGESISFIIDVTKAGEGQLELMVNDGDTPNEVDGIQPGVYRVTFVPVVGGTQYVAISFNDEAIPGSPFPCTVMDLGRIGVVGFSRTVVVHRICNFTLRLGSLGSDIRTEVGITSPFREKVTATIIEQPNGDYNVEWIPTVPGTYTIEITAGDRPINGSPFYVNVFDPSRVDIYDVYGEIVHEEAGFTYDVRDAGNADLDIKIESPSGRVVVHHTGEERNNRKSIYYTPEEVGKYTIFISYGGLEIQGSPLIQVIGEGRMPMAEGDGLRKGIENYPASFIIHSQGLLGRPTVIIDGPQSIAKVNVDRQSDGAYLVTYIPVEVGTYNLQVKWNDKHIPGSPFYPVVINVQKVRIIGGWHQYMDSKERIKLEVDEQIKIPFDVSEAGPGELSCEVRGQHGNPNVYTDMGSGGKGTVSFIPKEEGVHYIYFYWNEHLISGSHYIGYAIARIPDITKVVLSGLGVREAAVRHKAEFLVDGSDAGEGVPEVRLLGVKDSVPVNVTHFGGGKYRCSYIPMVPGTYLLHISWFNRQLRGSPYKVNVINACFPEKVVVKGEGLSGGAYGRHFQVAIDTKAAGPGELTAHCMGPHEVAYCALQDKGSGVYTLIIKPKEPGRHVLQIKYGGEHVLGSPYILRIFQNPDASKVKVFGPGIEHGILQNYQSKFMVQTQGAGPGKLLVRVRGPKGAFNVEMHRESQKERTILCRYSPHEIGLYNISVRWSDVEVPGSPFECYIVDTQEDLDRIISGTYVQRDSMTDSDPFSQTYRRY